MSTPTGKRSKPAKAKETYNLRIFADELELIPNPELQGFAKYALNSVPDYFWEEAASSTGKYHPPFAHGKGGLVRHTKAAIAIADALFPIFCEKTGIDGYYINHVVIAVMFHDVLKFGLGRSQHTRKEHALDSAEWILNTGAEYSIVDPGFNDEVYLIGALIRTHMGVYGETPYEEHELIGHLQRFVSLCDYISSQDNYMNRLLLMHDQELYSFETAEIPSVLNP